MNKLSAILIALLFFIAPCLSYEDEYSSSPSSSYDDPLTDLKGKTVDVTTFDESFTNHIIGTLTDVSPSTITLTVLGGTTSGNLRGEYTYNSWESTSPNPIYIGRDSLIISEVKQEQSAVQQPGLSVTMSILAILVSLGIFVYRREQRKNE